MQKLHIKKFGPIDECRIEIHEYMVFTGPQASGKSTVAKSIFFFNNLKIILLQMVQRDRMSSEEAIMDLPLAQKFKREVRSIFLQIFGTTLAMDPDMEVSFIYGNGQQIKISLTDMDQQRNFADVFIGENMWNNLYKLECLYKEDPSVGSNDIQQFIYEQIFDSDLDVVYIPAGRSLMTLLTSQINYLYSTMDDIQKRSMDYCTQSYLEKILQLKSAFTTGYEQMIADMKATTAKRLDLELLNEASELARQILKGEYRNVYGEERLQITDDHFVKINFASSGQQEVVWILNVLFYYMLNAKNAMFIIEEPESHLYPESQKKIIEYISMAKNHKNRLIITTHSPYVLGSINNLLYASKIEGCVGAEKLERLVGRRIRISYNSLGAYFLERGKMRKCTDDVYQNIENEVIDGASDEINETFEGMLELVSSNRGDQK